MNLKNHKKSFFAALICLPIIFTSCDFGNYSLPSSITVKTDADLGLYLGKVNYDFSNTLDINSLTEQMTQSLGENVQVYQYLDDESEASKEDALTYLVHYPVAKVELDVGTYLNDLNLDSMLSSSGSSGMNFSQTLNVPKVSSSLENSISVNLVDKISNYSSTQFGDDFNIPLFENSDVSVIETALSGHNSINFESIATVFYSTGSSIDIVFNKTDSNVCGSDFSFKVIGKIVSSSGEGGTETLISQSSETEVKNGGTVSIPIGKDKISSGLPPKFKFTMEVSLSGNASTPHAYSVSMGLSSSSKIEKIENITASSQDLREGKVSGFDEDENFGKISIENTEVSLESAYGYFESATINSGHIAFYNEACAPLDNSKMQTTYKISIKGCGLNLTQDNFTEDPSKNGRFVNKYLDLNGQTINFSSVASPSDAKLTLSGEISYEVKGATIDLTGYSNENLSVKFISESVLDSLYNVKVDFTNDKYSSITTSYSLPTTEEDGGTALSEQLISYVSKISFGQESGGNHYKSNENGNISSTPAQGFGVVCNVKNTLPVEIPVNIKSTMFDLDVKDTISSNSDTKTYNWVSYPTVDLSSYKNDEKHFVDFSFALELEEDKYLTLGSSANPFVLDKDYEISLEYQEMKMDWDSVTLRSGGVSIPVEQSFDGFSLDSILSGTGIDSSTLENVKISRFDVYLYVQKPSSTSNSALNSLINKIGFNGKTYISYTDSNSSTKTQYIIGSETSGENLTFRDDEITWPASGTNISTASGSATAEFAKNFLDSSKYSFKSDLADIVNEQPETIKFVSDLALTNSSGGNLVVYKSMIDGLSESDKANIGIDMLAYIPFELKLSGDISLDLMELIDKTWSTDNANKDLLNRADDWAPASWAEYSKAVENLAVYYNITNTVFSDFNLTGQIKDSASNLSKTINLNTNSSNVLELTGTEINNILTNKPFHPSVLLTLDGGTSESPKILKIKRSVLDSNSSNTVSASVTMRLDVDKNSEISISDLTSAFGGK